MMISKEKIDAASNEADRHRSTATMILLQHFSKPDAEDIVNCIIRVACIEFAVAQAKAAKDVFGA